MVETKKITLNKQKIRVTLNHKSPRFVGIKKSTL